MTLTLAGHLALIDEELAAARAARLSRRRALLVAALLDVLPDRVFAARRTSPEAVLGAADLPAYRAALMARSPALATVVALCAGDPGGPTLTLTAWPVTDAELTALPVEDFMVSLYNAGTVPRLVVGWPDGRRELAHEVLAEAVRFLAGAGGRVQRRRLISSREADSPRAPGGSSSDVKDPQPKSGTRAISPVSSIFRSKY